MISTDTIQRFREQMTAMHSVAGFLAALGGSFPPVFTLVKPQKLPPEERQLWGSSVQQCAEFVLSLHPTKSLYVAPPTVIPVDPACPALDFSDHLQERLGKMHPFFDFIHAPFTRPLGTQFSLIFITYAWDAYDTFISEVLRQCCEDTAGGDTEEKLRQSKLLPSDQEIAAEYARLSNSQPVTPPDIPNIILAAKLLRNSFSHRSGNPMPRLKRMVDDGLFHQQLIRFLPDGEFEVVLPMAKLISDVIIAKVELIQARSIAV